MSKTYTYDYTDKILKILKRKYAIEFTQLKSKIADFDELNVLHNVSDLYDMLESETIRYLDKIYYKYYGDFKDEIPYLVRLDTKEKSKAINRKSKQEVKKWCKSYAPLTAYVFLNELKRKEAKLQEAIISTHQMEQVDKALKSWWVQVLQATISITDEATINGAKDAGYTKVIWITQEDEKVCKECRALDKKVFNIDNIPDKPHMNCRCTLKLVRENLNRKS